MVVDYVRAYSLDDSNRSNRIINVIAGHCLDIAGASNVNGTPVQVTRLLYVIIYIAFYTIQLGGAL